MYHTISYRLYAVGKLGIHQGMRKLPKITKLPGHHLRTLYNVHLTHGICMRRGACSCKSTTMRRNTQKRTTGYRLQPNGCWLYMLSKFLLFALTEPGSIMLSLPLRRTIKKPVDQSVTPTPTQLAGSVHGEARARVCCGK